MSSGRSFTTSFLTKYNNAAVSEFKKQLGELKKEMSDNKREQKELSKEIRDAQKEIKLINAEIKRTGQTTEEQKKRLDELTNSINTDKEALEKLKLQQAQIQGKINATNAAIEQQNKAFAEMKDSINNAKAAAGDFVKTLAGVTAAATAAVSGLFAFTSQAAQWADEVNTLSKTTGISTNELQKFMYATDLIDVSVETLSGALTKLTRNMAEPSKAASEAFDTLKVSTTDATGALRDRQEVFYEVIEALGRVGNETERDALAMDIFGKSAQELNPLIKGGAQVLKELGDEAERAGLILSQETLDGLNQFNDKLDLLKSKGTAIKNLAAAEMTPAFDGLLEVADELLDDINEMAQSGELKKLAKELGEGIKNAANALKNIIKFVWEYKDAIGAAVKGMIAFKLSMSITGVISNVVSVIKTLTTASTAAATATTALGASMSKLTAVGAVVSVVAGLTTALVSLYNAEKDSTEVIDDYNRLIEESKEKAAAYTSGLRELREKTESGTSSAQAEVEIIRLLNDEYDALRKKTNLTSTEKERLTQISGKLAGQLGLTTDQLRDQTGAYRDLSKEIDTYLGKLLTQAKYEYYEETIKEAVRSSEELNKKIKEQGIALGEARIKLVEMEREYEKQGKLHRDKNGFVYWDKDAQDALNKQRDVIRELERDYNSYNNELKNTNKILDDAKGDYQDYIRSVNDFGSAVGGAGDEAANASDETADLAKEQKELQSQSSSLRSEMSSLASSLSALEKGQALNLNQILQLIEKYPEFAGELLNAAGNADLQKQALEHLFEAKKAEYILSLERAEAVTEVSNNETATILENTAAQIEAYQGLGNVMGNVSLAAVLSNQIVAATLREQAKNLREAKGSNEDTINYLKSLSLSDFENGFVTDTSKSSSGSGSTSGTDTKTAPLFETNARGVYASGSSYIAMYTQWLDRTKSLGMMTVEEEEKLLAELLKREENTDEERYQLKQRLYKARETLAKDAAAKEKEAADKAAEAEKEAEKKREEAAERRRKKQEERDKQILEKQNLMLAAYKCLVDNRVDALNAEAQAAEDAANREIAAIDKKIEKRKQEESIDKKQQELAKIDAKLRYGKLTDFERYELEKRRQEINNDISAEYRDREYENQKERLRSGAEAVRSRNDTAIAGLRASETQLSDHVAALQGNQSYDQRVKNNSTAVNVNIVNQGLNGLSIDQLVVKTVREVVKALGGT